MEKKQTNNFDNNVQQRQQQQQQMHLNGDLNHPHSNNSDSNGQMSTLNVLHWTENDVIIWLKQIDELATFAFVREERLDGKSLLAVTEDDVRDLKGKYAKMRLGDWKRFWIAVRGLQKENYANLVNLGLIDATSPPNGVHQFNSHLPHIHQHHSPQHHHHHHHHQQQHNQHCSCCSDFGGLHDLDRISPPLSIDGQATSIPPEIFKTVISLGYVFLVTWITAFVMVVVHERVPDMQRYPPLPDIFLDNVPHIPWAFHMCEFTGTLLFIIWASVLIVHKHRLVLLRRFFALSGTVFLLRCVTMLITSLSVPGTHLQCRHDDFQVDDTNLPVGEAVLLRVSRAYTIWSGLGMTIQGVRTCGDYMFSGHTVALTIMNFFITEYTPRHLYFLHTITWLLNMFGIFFILAAHEHYSIDVFVAFYITSRLFLYYHTLANNQALTSHDSTRTRIWFPMFSYFESSVDGIIPNEYTSLEEICADFVGYIRRGKDCVMSMWRQQQNTPFRADFIRKLSNLKLSRFVDEATINGSTTTPLLSSELLASELTYDSSNNPINTQTTNTATSLLSNRKKLHENTDFGDTFVLKYPGNGTNKKVI